jgi:hypothetical protein
MQKALTFGIEIEMAVASVPADTPSEPLEHRICRFDDTSPNGEREPWRIVGEHIARTLHAAGFESSVSDVDESHSTKWDLTYDTSVSLGEFWNDSRARPVESMELRSPALHSTEKAYDAIQEVCAILPSTYCLNTNRSTGLHVHIGNRNFGWTFGITKRLMAFLWAFTPQIFSLVPEHRQTGLFAGSMRHARFSRGFERERGRLPSPIEGVQAILKCKTPDQLRKRFSALDVKIKENLIFVSGLGEGKNKPTIEFRYMSSSLESESIVMFIKLFVGIMEYVRDVDTKSFTDLISIVEFETWDKLGDGLDESKQQEMGAILVEQSFTIVDLLETMGLSELAKYFKERGFYQHKNNSGAPKPLKRYYWLNPDSEQGSTSPSDGHRKDVTPTRNLPEIPFIHNVPVGDAL